MNKRHNFCVTSLLLICAIACTGTLLHAQTSLFTYQGRLTDNTLVANGTYEMLFTLFDAGSGGTQIGSPLTRTVVATNGIFTVTDLSFGSPLAFSGASRFLEIAVRPSGSPNPFTVLNPRQLITSVPYSIRSLNSGTADIAINSTQLGGVTANQFVQTGDARLSDDRNPIAGSGNYIRNTFIQQQANASFNIAGLGTVGSTFTANLVRSNTQFDIGQERALGIPGTNTFVGVKSGFANTGADNSFFGFDAGRANTTGSNNSFFGKFAGDSNTDGNNNSFFGESAGTANGSGGSNSFFGYNAGLFNTGGAFNSFFGRGAGDSNLVGNFNAFFGYDSGSFTSTGDNNAFFGRGAGNTNTIGNNNTVIGADSDVSLNNLTFATAIGAGAVVNASNKVVIGRVSDTVSVPGSLTANSVTVANGITTSSIAASGITTQSLEVTTISGTSGIITMGDIDADTITLLLPNGGSEALCHNINNTITRCSSSLRYKTNIASFNSGLDLVNRLRPITFDWKDGGMADLGLGAEEVENIEPLLVTYNKDGQVEGVKYDRIGVVLLNAVQEQQAQIKVQQENAQRQQTEIESQLEEIQRQRKRLDGQQILIDSLRTIVCQNNPQAEVCRKGEKY